MLVDDAALFIKARKIDPSDTSCRLSVARALRSGQEGKNLEMNATPEDEGRRGAVTRLLQDGGGHPEWAEKLLPLIYEELRALARARMASEKAGQTIQATALVHDAYLRLVGDADPGWNSRGHFFGAAAEAMRRILVERARRRARVKHGGGLGRVELDDDCAAIEPPRDDVLAVDQAVRKLEASDPRKGRIVKLRYFVGFTVAETADALVNLGNALRVEGRNVEQVEAVYREAAEAGREAGTPEGLMQAAMALFNLGNALRAAGRDVDQVEALYREAAEAGREAGTPKGLEVAGRAEEMDQRSDWR